MNNQNNINNQNNMNNQNNVNKSNINNLNKFNQNISNLENNNQKMIMMMQMMNLNNNQININKGNKENSNNKENKENFNSKIENPINFGDNIIKEAHIDGHISSMSLKTMKYLCERMEKSICKIQKPNNKVGTGFLCNIKDKNNSNPIPVIMTCNHVLDGNDLMSGKEIDLIFNNIQHKKLIINKKRKIYTNEDQDISIIEIKKSDKINEEDFLELEENIFNENMYSFYNKKQVYILHYPNGNEIRYSTDFIRGIDEQKDEIQHFCSTNSGSSGAPILNFETGKVIGVHFGYNQGKKINLGRLLKNPINDFYGLCQSEKNEIILTLLINNDDIKKEIYFLDNINYTDDLVTEKKPDSSLKELNKSNTNLFINDKKMDYSKFFIPEYEGIYTIKLEFSIKMTDCQQMFHGCTNITNINLLNFASEDVTNMKYMFAGCRNLINIDLSSFNTENVINMSYMFYDCINLEKIDISAFNTEKVTDMSGMFCGFQKITSLDISCLNTKNVVNMTHMFYRCENISFLDLSNFDTTNVTNMSGLFAGCRKLNNLDLSKFNTKNVYFMSH
jgi:surface protein